jgi:hypothetical protein
MGLLDHPPPATRAHPILDARTYPWDTRAYVTLTVSNTSPARAPWPPAHLGMRTPDGRRQY